MALFNKLFTNRRNTHNKHQDNVSEKLFAFSKDQVRVVLFRECDFRGRKLLFDSSSVKKVSLNPDGKPNESSKTEENEKISEICDGFGYIYTKPGSDFNQLAEMVFGSVAMSFRGTYFKMHNLDSPNRLMFTQVFSSPRHAHHSRMLVSSRSDAIEHSKLDDSGASSSNSMSEHLSVHSTTSDTILVCRRQPSAPLDVPNGCSNSIPSLIGDSGYCAEHYYTNASSGPSSMSTWGSSVCGEKCASTLSLYSNNTVYKKWLRKTSFSLGQSGQSLASSDSIQEGISGRPHRPSKLGLACIVELTPGQEEALGHFIMEHVSLVESMLWRARQVVERACIRSQNFTSLMVEMAQISAQYLVNLLSGSYLSLNLWLTLSSGCDNYNSIRAFSASFSDKTYPIGELSFSSNGSSVIGPQLHVQQVESNNDFNLFNFTRFLRTEWDPFNIKKNFFGEQKTFTAEKFVRDFCELLEIIDVKDTNFFMSTLLTAVLTHHLGWVNTCLPSEINESVRTPFNPLWSELSDLYGAIGHPTKMAQTIITGTNRKDLVSKILVSLTYFIRCCDVERRVPVRVNVEEENLIIETLCRKAGSIPKENFKKYEDHLKEIQNINKEFLNSNNNNNIQYKCERDKCRENGAVLKKTNGLQKTKTCLGNLTDLNGEDGKTAESCSKKTCEEVCRHGLTRVSTSGALCRLNSENNKNIRKINTNSGSNFLSDEQTRNVVFVLGESDQLVGLKKEKIESSRTHYQRPSFLDLSRKSSVSSAEFKDGDFIENKDKNLIKPSTSWSSLAENDIAIRQQKIKTDDCGAVCTKYPRSQSVPPEERKSGGEEDSKNQSKYRYSGVKFNLQQYPQILSNYMKSKNLEMSHLQFGDKGVKIDELSSLGETIKFPEFNVDYEESEALQTPSNASELEFTSDLFEAPQHAQRSQDDSPTHHSIVNKQVPNTLIKNFDTGIDGSMRVAILPMPKSEFTTSIFEPIKYTTSLMRAASDDYMPDMVLQAPNLPKKSWESKLKSDLILASQHSLLDQHVDEAVAVLANTDSWEVQLMSSHTYVIDKGSSGIRVGMSQLVSNMLESLLQMWKLNVSPHYCLMHIEQTLQELCIRSKALAELLLATEFCSMEQLTSTLQLEVNDVPLLLAVASTHSPQVTQKYGLSFQ